MDSEILELRAALDSESERAKGIAERHAKEVRDLRSQINASAKTMYRERLDRDVEDRLRVELPRAMKAERERAASDVMGVIVAETNLGMKLSLINSLTRALHVPHMAGRLAEQLGHASGGYASEGRAALRRTAKEVRKSIDENRQYADDDAGRRSR